jgi:hypothetical protein
MRILRSANVRPPIPPAHPVTVDSTMKTPSAVALGRHVTEPDGPTRPGVPYARVTARSRRPWGPVDTYRSQFVAVTVGTTSGRPRFTFASPRVASISKSKTAVSAPETPVRCVHTHRRSTQSTYTDRFNNRSQPLPHNATRPRVIRVESGRSTSSMLANDERATQARTKQTVAMQTTTQQ